MSDLKEFEGKNLDEAIENACDYFNLKREKLEIEILGGGSTGIFGIMGVKKAKVKARPRAQVNASDILNEPDDAKKPKGREKETKSEPKKPVKPKKPKQKDGPEPGNAAAPKPADGPAPGNAVEPGNRAEPEVDYDALDAQVNGNVVEPEVDYDALDDQVNGNVAPAEETARPRERQPRERKPKQNKRQGDRKPRERKPRERKPRQDARQDKPRHDNRQEKPREERPRANLEEFDAEVLETAVREVMTELLNPIVGETVIEVTIEADRVKVFIDDEENSGLIIGREGQTLSSLQYLVNRIVSRRMEASIRVQVDTGDYRERQDEKLRQIANHLADKAADLGRTQSTKPLSSYHRRVVHLTLQDDEDVFTRSKGDGPMKRVLIVPKNRKDGRR